MTTSTRIAVALANLGAFALLALAVAYWGWTWFGPAPYHATPRELPDPAKALAVSPPFGAPTRELPTGPATAPATFAGDARLLGVLAQADGRGHALFRLADGSARLVAAGEALGQGATLLAVHPDGVTIRDASGDRSLALRAPPGAPATTAAKLPSAKPAAPSACAAPAGFTGAVVRLNAELVQGLMQQPETLRALADPGQDGLVIRDDTGFAALLGLRKGDRMVQANGIALRAPEDIIVAVLRPLAASQPVRVGGVRGSEAREMLIVNASVCR
jgi:hypothetical protein